MINIDIEKKLGRINIKAKFSSDNGIVAIFGRSGCGKTTIINMLAGLEKPDSGMIKINNKLMFDSHSNINIATEKRNIGYVFQQPRLFPHLNVAKNLKYGIKANNHGNISFDQMVEILDIAPLLSRNISRLSGGEQQRIAIGRAILSNPDILLMDEPLTNLDMTIKDEILSLIKHLAVEISLPIIYASHAMDEILKLADNIALIDNGKIIAYDSVEKITSRMDLYPMTGKSHAGSVLSVIVASHDIKNSLSHLKFNAGEVIVPLINDKIGKKLRIRIRANDIILSLKKPIDVSSLNILQGNIKEIDKRNDDRSPHVNILLDIGQPLWVRITKLSANRLNITENMKVFAMIKTVAIERKTIG